MPDIHDDFSRAAWLTPEQFRWVPSPGGEVERVMLDRRGDEVAVATSLVRYPPASRFPAHRHPGGEEYLVLEGEFADEHGRYPAGTYVRNPPGSGHAPFSDPGCVIWVKLRQFHPDDGQPLVTGIDLDRPQAGTAARVLHAFSGETVSVGAGAAGAELTLPGGDWVQELLVIDGIIGSGGHRFGPWGWLRVPAGEGMALTIEQDARWLHKTRPAFALP
ncbi:MAG: cupin domain-containing protein [Pseudomonadales bacterium]